ncbi:hypothetical protein D3C73_856090 [compost metagenome]
MYLVAGACFQIVDRRELQEASAQRQALADARSRAVCRQGLTSYYVFPPNPYD